MSSVIFDPDAQSEFIDAIRFYEEHREGLGRRFLTAMNENCRSAYLEESFAVSNHKSAFQTLSLIKISIFNYLLYRARAHLCYFFGTR